MGEIAGSTSFFNSCRISDNANNGKGIMLGSVAGISPPELVIIGAGTVGQFAASAALAMGVSVKVFDNSLFKLRRLQNEIGYKIFTSVIQLKFWKKP